MDYLNKIFAIYKPEGVSSNKILYNLKQKYKGEKVGHAGTLDPMAKGVLVVGVGRKATKKLGELSKDTKKTYLAEIEIGKNSTTDDREGEIKTVNSFIPKLIEVKKCLNKFKGEILQIPPNFSAIKIKGQRAYKKARNNEDFKLEARRVKVYKIKLLDYKYPLIKLEIICGSGTYIRAIARDLGNELKTGGYLKDLIRTAVGKYTIDNAVKF